MNHSMKTLALQIGNLLYENDCVIIPGLGGFITNYKSAAIHPTHHIFSPPSKRISFNSALIHNDGVLLNSYVRYLGVDYNQAGKIVESLVLSIRISLLRGEFVNIENIGTLKLNKENNIEFEPVSNINYLGDSFGLPKFDFHPVSRTNEKSLAGINQPAIRKTMRWAAVLVPVAAIALWSTFNSETINTIQNNYAGVFSTTEKTINIPAQPVKKTISFEGKSGSGISVAAESSSRVTSEIPKSSVVENTTSYYIIAGAFSIPENAERLVIDLKKKGFDASLVGQNSKKLHIVSLAHFTTKESANLKLAEVQQVEFPEAWLLEKTN